ncbi:LSU ribosomal protein L10p (P0) [invertebrate metagenome]|uniref:LSU ribosomal protein L10p (P0) n=1 Tax=invertebrate metagenome TaxID=1711999 RepID=A0A484H8E2_9ZZZZ
MNRNQKKELVSALHNLLGESAIVVVVHYKGMKVSESAALRSQMREAGAHFKVTKNRLMRLALAKTCYEGLASLFVGQTAIACSQDPVTAARVVAKYAKGNNKLVIIGGGHGATLLTPDRIEALAALPSLAELRAKLVGVLKAPATRIANLLQTPARQLAQVLKAYADRDQSKTV